MEIIAASTEGSFRGLNNGETPEFLFPLLESQRALFRSQIDEFQRVVVAQCRLTGVNPLAQEMAAGALSIKIGKRPRDLLNPKATKYMSSVFSIKDTIGKKETREISALCGITVTQVREFFAGQRSRVRRFVRLSREEAIGLDVAKGSLNNCITSSDQSLPCNSASVMVCQIPDNLVVLSTSQDGEKIPAIQSDVKPEDVITFGPLQENAIPGFDSEDKKFFENIFSLMKKEQTFSGQVKLMDWVLQIHNSAVLDWFLMNGATTILATWLSEAAVEEQTTLILVIFKVLCHMPLHKAMPAQVSAILQTVNRLRFYRTSDISNRARILLSRWSKLFIRNQLKIPVNNSPSHIRKHIVRNQRICEILSDESWKSRIDMPEEILALTESSETKRKQEPKQILKLLPAASDELNGKQYSSVSSPKTKHRRKVLLVEQPDHRITGRGTQVTRVVPSSSSRPLSADDIQKAKMRAIFLQNKHGRNDLTASENQFPKPDLQNVLLGQMNKVMSSHRTQTTATVAHSRNPEVGKTLAPDTSNSSDAADKSVDAKLENSSEVFWERFKSNQIRWRTPPAMPMDSDWRVASGESSKEVETQYARMKREEETFYNNPSNIPPNPKDPWDIEMDFDDSLTLVIPTDPPPDSDANIDAPSLPPVPNPLLVQNAAMLEPDLELLAVLLKNPELVFALTSGQGSGFTPEQTVALLDAIKKSSAGSIGSSNTIIAEPTSLPSPTPVSERYRSPLAENSFESRVSQPSSLPLAPSQAVHARGYPSVAALPANQFPAAISFQTHVRSGEHPPTTLEPMNQFPATVSQQYAHNSTVPRTLLPAFEMPGTVSGFSRAFAQPVGVEHNKTIREARVLENPTAEAPTMWGGSWAAGRWGGGMEAQPVSCESSIGGNLSNGNYEQSFGLGSQAVRFSDDTWRSEGGATYARSDMGRAPEFWREAATWREGSEMSRTRGGQGHGYDDGADEDRRWRRRSDRERERRHW